MKQVVKIVVWEKTTFGSGISKITRTTGPRVKLVRIWKAISTIFISTSRAARFPESARLRNW